MSICVCNNSALELYRASSRLLPELMSSARTSKLESGRLLSERLLAEDMRRVGVTEKPFHVLLGNTSCGRGRDDIVRHPCSDGLPPRSIIRASRDVWTVSPEYLMCQYAARAAAPSDPFDLVDLILVGYELCGTYLLDASIDDGFVTTEEPLTSRSKIERFCGRRGRFVGVRMVRRALRQISDMSNSPRESIVSMLLTMSLGLGGLGLRGSVMNYEVETDQGVKRVDIAWPKLGVGVEYQGRKYHAVEQAQREDRRRNTLAGSGMTIITVWNEDLRDPVLFERFVGDVTNALGVRVRVRSEAHRAQQRLLRARLLNEIKPYIKELS